MCATWPEGALHLERFKPVTLEPIEATSFTVELRRAGVTLTVPEDKTILKAIQDTGMIVPCSCEEGTCGTCETTVIAGVPEHRDSVLTEKEKETNRVMMICVSRSKSDHLILDL
jgi:ferredoxin